MPLRQIFKTDPNDAIKSGGSQRFAGRRWALRDVLLAAQIALCCVTVTAAFVSLRGLGKALTMDLGFQPRNAVLTKFELSQAGYSSEAADHFQRQLLEKVSQLPGVEAAGYVSSPPLDFPSLTSVFSQQTTDLRPTNKAFTTYFFYVSPGYFAAAGTPLLAGRDVSFADTPKTPLVAVVNREFARRLFPLRRRRRPLFQEPFRRAGPDRGHRGGWKIPDPQRRSASRGLLPDLAGPKQRRLAHRPFPGQHRRNGRHHSQSDPRS